MLNERVCVCVWKDSCAALKSTTLFERDIGRQEEIRIMKILGTPLLEEGLN